MRATVQKLSIHINNNDTSSFIEEKKKFADSIIISVLVVTVWDGSGDHSGPVVGEMQVVMAAAMMTTLGDGGNVDGYGENSASVIVAMVVMPIAMSGMKTVTCPGTGSPA